MNIRKIKVKDEKEDYTCYYPYPCTRLPVISSDGLQTTSIDIAIKHFAIRIEKRFPNGSIELLYFNKIDFREPISATSSATSSTSTSIVATNKDDESESKGTTKISPAILNRITEFLTSLLPAYYNAPESVIGIERQMAINYKATRIFQHVLSFFMIHAPYFKNYCMIVDINPQLKGNILGAPRKLTYNELKTWSIDKAIEILRQRGDSISITILQTHRGKTKTKADDLADTVVQMEAWIRLVYR